MENRQQNNQQGVIYESKKLSGKPQQVNWNVDTSFSKSIKAASNFEQEKLGYLKCKLKS